MQYYILEFMAKVHKGYRIVDELQKRIIQADDDKSAEALGKRYVAGQNRNNVGSDARFVAVRNYPAGR